MIEIAEHACSCVLNKIYILNHSMIRSIPGLIGQISHPHVSPKAICFRKEANLPRNQQQGSTPLVS